MADLRIISCALVLEITNLSRCELVDQLFSVLKYKVKK